MNKSFFVAFVAILLLPIAFGETLSERSFAEMGYESFLVEGPQETGCQEVIFIYPEDIAVEDREIYPVASIGIEFGPIQEGKTDVNLSLNQQPVASLSTEDFKCREELCWERLSLPKQFLEEEENSLVVCMGTGNSIMNMLLSNESRIGLYKAADFLDESAFVTRAEKTELVIGEKTTINIVLHNQGSDSAFAEIKFARPLAEDKNAFSVVEGDAYFTGIVGAGEQAKISYVLKPRISATMTLPPAIVYYENEFGELESKFGNLVTLNVRQPERKIEAFIVKEEETVLIGQPIEVQLGIKNVGSDPLYDLSVEIEGDVSISQQKTLIESIKPKETKYLPFTLSGTETGKFAIGCTISYIDQNLSESFCQQSFVEFRQQEIGPEIYAAIFLVAIAVIVYIYIMRS